MILTNKQRIILSCIISGNPECEGTLKEWLSIGELTDILPYETSRDSMQFSIRALMKKNLIEKGAKVLRNGRWQVPIVPTDLAVELVPQLQQGKFSVSAEEFNDVVFEGF